MASYVGLATGGGAAEGLETLLARIREEEQLNQNKARIDNEQRRMDEEQRFRTSQQSMMGPYYEALGKEANTRADSTAAGTELTRAKLGILRDVTGSEGGTGGAGASAPPPEGDYGAEGQTAGMAAGVSPARTGGAGLTDTPATRVKLQVAGITPGSVFPGAEGPANITPEESYLKAWAGAHGVQDWRSMSLPQWNQAKQDYVKAGRDPLALERFQMQQDRFAFDKEREMFRREQATERQRLAQSRFDSQLGAPYAGMALREFSDRIMREIKQDDPPDKYDSIRDEILSKYQDIKQRGQGQGGGANPPAGVPQKRRTVYDMRGNPISK